MKNSSKNVVAKAKRIINKEPDSLKNALIKTKEIINKTPKLFNYDSYNTNGESGCVLFHLAKVLNITIDKETTGQSMIDEVLSIVIIDYDLANILLNNVFYFTDEDFINEGFQDKSNKNQILLANKKIDEFIKNYL